MSILPNIAIIGAGPGGLTLARFLQQGNVPFQIFELDEDPIARNQGGTLDLLPELGQLAIRAAGLYEEFSKRARFEGDCVKLVIPNGTVVLDEATYQAKTKSLGGRPEIDRLELRLMLLCSLRPEAVRWGHKLLQVEPHAPNSVAKRETYTLHFNVSGELHQEGPFDIVIGADGAHSKVRPLLTDQQPFYCDITSIRSIALNVDEKKKWLANYVGPGSCYMFDEGRSIVAQRNGDGSIRVYACLRQPKEWLHTCGIDWTIPNEARKQLVDQYFSDCAVEIKRIILDADDELGYRYMEMLPIGLSWAPRGGVTLIGDAAHLMTPFGGKGVNAALYDAMELGQALVHGIGKNQGVDGAIQELALYEKCMFERNRGLAQVTLHQMELCFSRDGSEKLAKIMTSPREPAPTPEVEEDAKVQTEGGRAMTASI